MCESTSISKFSAERDVMLAIRSKYVLPGITVSVSGAHSGCEALQVPLAAREQFFLPRPFIKRDYMIAISIC
jgi:hypothetical protein